MTAPRIRQIGDSPYLVDDRGRVWKFRESWMGCFLQVKQYTNNRGYKVVRVWKDNKRRAYVVHVLVARTFHPLPQGNGEPVDYVVRHLNGKKHDNRAVNLAWGTQSENVKDWHRHRKERRNGQGRAD